MAINQIDTLSRFSDYDVHLFREGKHAGLYDKFGAHLVTHEGVEGAYFAVWAPNASRVAVVGDFNGWNREEAPMNVRWDSSGIWEIFIPGAAKGHTYKYAITNRETGKVQEKGDPFAMAWEVPPKTASVIWPLDDFEWTDKKWMKAREKAGLDQPYSVYELHLGSWRRVAEEEGRSLSYREMAEQLTDYVVEMGFTHVEMMPVMEHPFFGSWGYQVTGFFAPSSRYGTPQDFMYLVDCLHAKGIGVILDWVPSHFPEDEFALASFDGTSLYEHDDPRKGFHPDWKSLIFNYGRHEVRSFLISSAVFWLRQYHADGLRVDAVASMLYLDYSRKDGEWAPNEHGGKENLEAISFLKELNEAVYANAPGAQTIAEESTSWPMVSRPTFMGGLGFGMKWMMGWMHDSLQYFGRDPIYRAYHQGELSFSMIYAFTENFMLPLSHDEVVHGKGSLISRMPGDAWQQFANLRLLYAYMYTHPGAKLLFMGSELGQRGEWNHDGSIDWHVLDYKEHAGIHQLIKDLNQLYKTEPGLYQRQFDPMGFEWVDMADHEKSVISFLRKGEKDKDTLLVVGNFTPATHDGYRIGVPTAGKWVSIFNSDDEKYWGSGQENPPTIKTDKVKMHGKPNSLDLKLAPLSIQVFKFKQK